MKKYTDIKNQIRDMEKMTSQEVSKHIKDASWDKAEDSVRALSDKILNIENKKEEKKEMKKLKK